MLFSATMPGAVVALARRYMSQPTHIRAMGDDQENAHTVKAVEQFVYRAHAMDKVEMLARMLQAEGRGLTIIFSRTKRTAAKVADDLIERGFAAAPIHGDLGQGAREQALRAFRNGKVDILVATDVAARGIDVDNVTHVINYQCPEDEKTYLHRIGRTARAGNTGIAVTFVDWDDLPRWGMINKALDLGIPEPEETYSSSEHFYEQLDIPRRPPRAACPRPRRSCAGLGAEVLEDLGETGKSSGRRPAAGGRGARDGGGRDGGGRGQWRSRRGGRGGRDARPRWRASQRQRPLGPERGRRRQAAPKPQPPPHPRRSDRGDQHPGLTGPTHDEQVCRAAGPRGIPVSSRRGCGSVTRPRADRLACEHRRMRGIRQHPLTQPVAVLAAVVLVCVATVVVLRTVPHQARLERWLEKQPGITRVGVSPGPDPEASDWASSAWVALDGELTPAAYSRFASAYEAYRVNHAWAGDWPLTMSDDTVSLPVSQDHAFNLWMRDLLARLVTDPHVLQVRVETQYVSAIVVESADPAATKAHLGPVLTPDDRVRVIRPGEMLPP